MMQIVPRLHYTVRQSKPLCPTGNHYATMTVDEICAEPVPQLVEDDAHLHLWTTNAFLFEAKT
jgi:N6-adenosine-specific RNA methylase IME4